MGFGFGDFDEFDDLNGFGFDEFDDFDGGG